MRGHRRGYEANPSHAREAVILKGDGQGSWGSQKEERGGSLERSDMGKLGGDQPTMASGGGNAWEKEEGGREKVREVVRRVLLSWVLVGGSQRVADKWMLVTEPVS